MRPTYPPVYEKSYIFNQNMDELIFLFESNTETS